MFYEGNNAFIDALSYITSRLRELIMNTTRIFQVSSELFWGFRVCADLMHFDDVKAVVEYIKQELKLFLLSRNLQCLVTKLEQTKFHIHHPYNTYNDLLHKSEPDEVVYICDHC